MTIKVTEASFNPWQEMQAYQQTLNANSQYGVCASYVTIMKEQESKTPIGKNIPAIDQDILNRMAYQTTLKWNVLGTLLIYRTGNAHPGEPTQLIAVWAAHQTSALEACHYLIDAMSAI